MIKEWEQMMKDLKEQGDRQIEILDQMKEQRERSKEGMIEAWDKGE